MAQGDPGLLTQESLIVIRNHQALNCAQITALHGAGDVHRVRLGDLDQTGQFSGIRINIHDRLQITHANAARDCQLMAGRQFLFKGRIDLRGAGGNAAAALSDYDLHADTSSAFLRSRMILRALSGVRVP